MFLKGREGHCYWHYCCFLIQKQTLLKTFTVSSLYFSLQITVWEWTLSGQSAKQHAVVERLQSFGEDLTKTSEHIKASLFQLTSKCLSWRLKHIVTAF